MGGKKIASIESELTVEDRGYDTPCWVWQRAKHVDGYGVYKTDGRLRRVHVLMYERSHGPVPDGMELDHLCGVRPCANPDHLEPVLHAINCRRGRNAKLTVDDVREIRAWTGKQVDMARRFDISEVAVSRIVNGHTWKEISVGDQGDRSRHGREAGGEDRQATRRLG